ncbi:MAG: PadR family transcriptional regulator [Imperialibacter sp.]|uniref:PadR family transcriptional regulator n=1 Tax=Imperialibacter sp. TaxID=2038411 RepID=UPI0032EE052F
MSSSEFIKGTLKTIILKLLAENKQMYGYEISQKVEELSGSEIKLTYGALYPVLYKLENEGLLVAETEVVEGRARKYYSLTPQGVELAKVKVSELKKFTETLKSILLPAPNISLEVWGA